MLNIILLISFIILLLILSLLIFSLISMLIDKKRRYFFTSKEPKEIKGIRKLAKEESLKILNADKLKNDLKEAYNNFDNFNLTIESYDVKKILKLLSVYYKKQYLENMYYYDDNYDSYVFPSGKKAIELFIKNNIISLPIKVEFKSGRYSSCLEFNFKY